MHVKRQWSHEWKGKQIQEWMKTPYEYRNWPSDIKPWNNSFLKYLSVLCISYKKWKLSKQARKHR